MVDIDRSKRYSIADVSKITGYDKHVLRFYETEFGFEIPRTDSNRRYYTYKEIERFFYLKDLQSKGLTNKQIKLVFNSPEILISANKEVALTTAETAVSSLEASMYQPNVVDELCQKINESIQYNLHTQLANVKSEIINRFDEMLNTDGEETNQIYRKEKDILICENARLRMKLKEKSYEVAELKEKIKRQHHHTSFWKKIFNLKKDMVL
ncbi:DNA-binding transcriptional MerR regulator [Anaerosolibacter carboniphilus]|uniref:DNA-binding transcriptional MerR regulator n=1 Tax=Anaerosolibacter carboniphilus TaxID=1417629 RepID=A0A841L2W3_9FIRM|nr:DNA-binding transcriptional MerR regulator [Anaerosolibacter carboniphilus]